MDIPLAHITSISVFRSRRNFLGLICFFTWLLMSVGGHWFAAIIPLVFAAFIGWGSPVVAINTAGTDQRGSKGWPWQTKMAAEFAEAVRNQVFK